MIMKRYSLVKNKMKLCVSAVLLFASSIQSFSQVDSAWTALFQYGNKLLYSSNNGVHAIYPNEFRFGLIFNKAS